MQVEITCRLHLRQIAHLEPLQNFLVRHCEFFCHHQSSGEQPVACLQPTRASLLNSQILPVVEVAHQYEEASRH